MLSLARSNAAGRCIRCAFRSQRLSLQQIRLGSSASHGRKNKDNERSGRPVIRYTNHSRQPEDDRGSRRPFNGKYGKKNKDYPEVLQERLQAMKEELKDAPIVEHYLRERREEGDKKVDFGKIWNAFTKDLRSEAEQLEKPWFSSKASREVKSNGLTADLRLAFSKRGQRGLDDRIKYSFYGHVTGERFLESDLRNQKDLADLRYPTEWYPQTRAMQRTIHMHVGPTNSGKTYHALQRLEQAEAGAYAGPLRLLAHEVYTRMTAKGKNCALVTGEERRVPEADDGSPASITSCTVEMMPLSRDMDVAVIDEIQMIGNAERGWAWTQALLGTRAKEVHLCGEERTVPLVKEICASVGDKLVIHNYKRLSPLKMADDSLNGKIEDLRKGDCIVSFSVMGIHALRKQIERATGRKVATVYGSLPPETRAQQARLFNDPDNDYDFLVASDAVGMGLNLAIKRVIFEASNKFDGAARRTLSIADIKQIAGRAGRYRTAAQATEGNGESKADSSENVGIVTTLEKFDFPVVKAAMNSEPEPIRSAGIFPPESVLERFSSYFPPGTPFSYILTRLHEISTMHKRYHLCGLKDQVWIADLIEPVQGLTIADRNTICSGPASQTDADLWRELMPAYARIVAEQTGGSLVDIPQLPLEVLDAEVSPSREYLRELERLHKGVVTYLWLSYRFAGVFNTRALAFHVKALVEEKIEEVLSKFSFTEVQRRKIAAKREKQLLQHLESVEEDADGNLLTDANTGEDVRSVETEVHDFSNLASSSAVPSGSHDELDDQTTLTSGGDRFGGEEDFGFEEPGELEAEIEAELETEPAKIQTATSSFAAWRDQHSSSTAAPALEAGPFETAHQAGEEVGLKSAKANTLDSPAASEPTAADVQPGLAYAETAPSSEKGASPEQDSLDLDASITEAVDLPEGKAPLETQEVSPSAVADEGHAARRKD